VTGTPFAWRAAIGFGLGILRLSPDDFWRMTPRELSCAIAALAPAAPAAPAPLERAAFEAMMRTFPDR
jgi:uncharacterized phage protein (TIGR02216 family)